MWRTTPPLWLTHINATVYTVRVTVPVNVEPEYLHDIVLYTLYIPDASYSLLVKALVSYI